MPLTFSLQKPKIVTPSAGNLPLSCPFCRGQTFAVHVEPTKNPGIATVREIVCATDKCQKALPVERGLLGGKVTLDDSE